MAVSILLPQFDGYGVNPDDITIAEAETQDVPVLINGRVRQVKLVRRSMTIKLKGIQAGSALAYINQAVNAAVSQIIGTPSYRDINVGGYTLRSAVLVKATPTASISFNGLQIMPSLELVYESQVFE
jgi:hypothetical protein